MNLPISGHIISKRLVTLIMEECERYLSLWMISIWCNIYDGMNYTLTHHQNLIQHLSFFLIFNISCVVYFINRACVRFYMKMTFEYFIGYKNTNMISIDIKMTLYPNTILIITFFKGFINLKYWKPTLDDIYSLSAQGK